MDRHLAARDADSREERGVARLWRGKRGLWPPYSPQLLLVPLPGRLPPAPHEGGWADPARPPMPSWGPIRPPGPEMHAVAEAARSGSFLQIPGSSSHPWGPWSLS